METPHARLTTCATVPNFLFGRSIAEFAAGKRTRGLTRSSGVPLSDVLFQKSDSFQEIFMLRRAQCFVLFFGLVLLGCGSGDDTPPLGEVTGTITLDGQPLEGVIVVFKPEVGRAATGTTDAQGKYTLEFSYGLSGCKVGPSSVYLEWPLGSTKAKALSPRYTTKSELKADVKEGSNTLDFALQSDSATPAKNLVIPD